MYRGIWLVVVEVSIGVIVLKNIAIVVTLTFTFLTTALTAQTYHIPESDFEAGGWFGFAFADEESGFLSHCVVSVMYENDQIISFSLTTEPSFALSFPVFSSNELPERIFEVSVFIDDLEPIVGLAARISEETASLGFPPNEQILDLFQSGWFMTIEVAGWKQTYKLRGTRKAIEAAKECYTKYSLYRMPHSVLTPPATASAPNPKADVPNKPTPGSTGSGFFVSSSGHVLTNSHVVQGCKYILVDGKSAQLVGSSELFDLAILETSREQTNLVASFASSPAKLNSDVTVVGYPLSGLLSGLNVTRGTISSSNGMKGDSVNMQITAPVQPGNSGGPVINANGAVVGVVVSKLNARFVSDASGDIPQNVNFAIRGEIAKLFLFQNGIEPTISDDNPPIAPVELAEIASQYTTFIECN